MHIKLLTIINLALKFRTFFNLSSAFNYADAFWHDLLIWESKFKLLTFLTPKSLTYDSDFIDCWPILMSIPELSVMST